MSRIAYVAGQYLPHRQAAVHIEDRGYQFGDGVYEVIAVTGGHLVDEGRHLARLHRSLTQLRINQPMSDSALKIVIREVVRRNGVDTGIVYLQVTRGVAPREHAFPKAAKPVLVVTSRRSRPADPRLGREGIAVITILDIIHREGYRLDERPFTVAEAKAAPEAFLTSTTADLLPIVRIDGAPVADGKPGPLIRKLREAYFLHAADAA